MLSAYRDLPLTWCVLLAFTWALFWLMLPIAEDLNNIPLGLSFAFGLSCWAFCCSSKHWQNRSAPGFGPHLTTAAELFYLRRLRSCAEAPHGCCSTSACGSQRLYTTSRTMHWASYCDVLQVTGHALCEHFLAPACEAYLRAILFYYSGNFCAPGTLHWHTAVALGSDSPVLAAGLFASLPTEEPAGALVDAWLRLRCAHGACVAVLVGLHMRRLWCCKVASAIVMAVLCSESYPAMACGFLTGWYEPAFPPKRSDAQMQKQLNKLREYVEEHAEMLRSRAGPTLLKRLRTRSADESKEEKSRRKFISTAQKNFNSDHREHFAVTEAKLSAATGELSPGDLEAATRASDEPRASHEQQSAGATTPVRAKSRKQSHEAVRDGAFPQPVAPGHAGTSDSAANGYRPGFTPDGKLILGGLHVDKKQGIRWRKQSKTEKTIMTPWRETKEEAIEDYIEVFVAQEAIEDNMERNAVMQRVAASLAPSVLGGVRDHLNGYQFRIQGKYAATGPWRETREAAEEDGRAANTEKEAKGAQKVLLRLQSYQTAKAKDRCNKNMAGIKTQSSQTALKAAAKDCIDMEVTLQGLILTEAQLNAIMSGLDLDMPVHELTHQHTEGSPDTYTGLKNMHNTCFANSILQVFLHVAALRRWIERPLPYEENLDLKLEQLRLQRALQKRN